MPWFFYLAYCFTNLLNYSQMIVVLRLFFDKYKNLVKIDIG